MSQHTTICKEGEGGNILESSQVNFADVINELYKFAGFQTEYPWIATINPYGDTVFNQIQIPLVIADLKKLIERTYDLKLQEDLRTVLSFLSKVDLHEYIRFIGD